MTTPILELAELTANQSQPHVTLNAAIRALEVFGQICVIDKDLTAPPASPSEGDVYIPGGGSTDEWQGWDNYIAYYSGGWQRLIPEAGWLAYVADEDAYYQYAPGSPSAWVLWSAGVGIPSEPYDIGAQISGAPSASLVMLRYKFPRTVVYPTSLTNSQGTAGTAATGQTDFDIQKNGSSIGTMRFAAAGTSASFIFASQQTFIQGDVLTVVAPAPPDATLAGISFVLAGTR